MADFHSFKQGDSIGAGEPVFMSALQAAVDYRGDCTLELTGGQTIEGYLYNARLNGLSGAESQAVDLFPKNSPRAETVNLSQIQRIIFSGEDTASGKSWDDWQKKKAAAENATL